MVTSIPLTKSKFNIRFITFWVLILNIRRKSKNYMVMIGYRVFIFSNIILSESSTE